MILKMHKSFICKYCKIFKIGTIFPCRVLRTQTVFRKALIHLHVLISKINERVLLFFKLFWWHQRLSIIIFHEIRIFYAKYAYFEWVCLKVNITFIR